LHQLLPSEDIAILESRAEGWIAGLQLAALSMQGRKDASSLIHSFTGSHHFVLDYLIEEVLSWRGIVAMALGDSHPQHLWQTRCPHTDASGYQGQSLGNLALHLIAWMVQSRH
jgi:hypothetical protein